MSLQAGETLGRYQILAPLGRGAMGQVYLALDPRIDRKVALKTVRVQGATSREAEERTKRLLAEARAAGRLLHGNVVALFDAGEDRDLVYLAFEYVDGGNLGERLQRQPPLTLGQALRIAVEVAQGLDHAHREGIVHRDIKPANILLDPQDRAKIADFGIAKIAGRDTNLTMAGKVVGSPNYMAPEQVRGETLDGRADIFALGAVVYEMLAGRKAFDGDTVTTLVYQILHEDPVSLAVCRPDLPPALAELLNAMLAKERDDRPETAGAVATTLARLAGELRPAAANRPVAEVGPAAPRRQPSALSVEVLDEETLAAAPRGAALMPTRPKRRLRTSLLVVGLLLIALMTAAVARRALRRRAERRIAQQAPASQTVGTPGLPVHPTEPDTTSGPIGSVAEQDRTGAASASQHPDGAEGPAAAASPSGQAPASGTGATGSSGAGSQPPPFSTAGRREDPTPSRSAADRDDPGAAAVPVQDQAATSAPPQGSVGSSRRTTSPTVLYPPAGQAAGQTGGLPTAPVVEDSGAVEPGDYGGAEPPDAGPGAYGGQAAYGQPGANAPPQQAYGVPPRQGRQELDYTVPQQKDTGVRDYGGRRAAGALARLLGLDRQVVSGTLLSLEVSPTDAEVLLKSPSSDELTAMGLVSQYDATAARTGSPLRLPRPGLYILVLRRAGMEEMRIGIRAEARADQVSTLQASLRPARTGQ